MSAVIPTYERPEYLEGAIKTVLGQTYENVEVIIVDDGSDSNYASEIVDEFPDSVSLIRHDTNEGLSAARNTGIEHSEGKYIAFLDDDDRWHERKLERQEATLEEQPRAGLATCLVAAITPENELVHCERTTPSGNCLDELMVRNVIGTPSRILVRREALKPTGGFDESLPTKQDWDFYIRLASDWEFVAVDDYLCFKTVHKSMSSSVDALRRDKSTILEKHENLIREHGKWDKARASVQEEVGRTHLDDGEFNCARRHLRNAASLELTKRRLLLLGLTFTPKMVFQRTVAVKRSLSSYLSDCPNIASVSDEIPGLQCPSHRS